MLGRKWNGCKLLVAGLAVCALFVNTTAGETIRGDVFQTYESIGGVVSITLNNDALAASGLRVADGAETANFEVSGPQSGLRARLKNAAPQEISGTLQTNGTTQAIVNGAETRLGNYAVDVQGFDGTVTDALDFHGTIFKLNPESTQVTFDADNQVIAVTADLVLAGSYFDRTGAAITTGAVGRLIAQIDMVLVDVDQPEENVDDVLALGGSGPDVIVGELQEVTEFSISSGIKPYSTGTTSCNFGNANLNWFQGPNPNHPVIAQAFYRLMEIPNDFDPGTPISRIEQIGQSWLKHGFCALQLGACLNELPACSPVCGGCCSQLGPGCSDPYTANRNATLTFLGPKFEIDPSAGTNLGNHATASGPASIRGRCQVKTEDLNPANLVAGATVRYFMEGQYVAFDDAQAGNKNNNASYREVNIGGPPNYNLIGFGWLGNTQRRQPGVKAWADNSTNVVCKELGLTNPTGTGLFNICVRAVQVGADTWDYEYAVHNLNSDRGAATFSVPIQSGTNVTDIGFHDVDYHSGEIQLGTDWVGTAGASQVEWAVPAVGSVSQRNLIRFGTTYNFRFRANAAPTGGLVTIGLIESGSPMSASTAVIVPGAAAVPCQDGDGDLNCNGVTPELSEVGLLVDAFMNGVPSGEEGRYDINGDNSFDGEDICAWMVVTGITPSGTCGFTP